MFLNNSSYNVSVEHFQKMYAPDTIVWLSSCFIFYIIFTIYGVLIHTLYLNTSSNGQVNDVVFYLVFIITRHIIVFFKSVLNTI